MSDKESFLEDIPQHIVDAEIQAISEQLFDEWMDSNTNEGVFYCDYRFAEMSGNPDIIAQFHEHWEIGPDDEHWLGE